MKKLLLTALLLSTCAAYAAGTYTEQMTQKFTQPLVEKEKQLQQEQQARQDAAEKARKDREAAAAKAQKERQDAVNAQQKKIDTKKKQLNDLLSP